MHMQIVESGERILGQHVLGFQVGNEPDLYARYAFPLIWVYNLIKQIVVRHQHRPQDYSPQSYFQEFGQWRDGWNNNANVQNKSNLIGPSLSLATWTMQQVWDTGFLDTYQNSLSALSVERLAQQS